jgi:hypothetical protein
MQIGKGFKDNWLQPTGAQENLMRQYVTDTHPCAVSGTAKRAKSLVREFTAPGLGEALAR